MHVSGGDNRIARERRTGYDRAMARHGLRVPEDISVVGYDGMRLLDSLDLTTVAQPLADMGRSAADLLMQRIADPDRPSVHRQVETRLISRGSTGPVRPSRDLWHPIRRGGRR